MDKPAAPPKVFIRTYGCQMNEHDSARMADVLAASHGYQRTDAADDADLLLFNTCSVREKAQEKVFSELGRWKDWKAARPGRRVGVGGCVASQEGAALVRRAPIVDVIFGPQTLHRLPQLLDDARRTGAPAVDVTFPEIEKFDALPAPRAEGPAALVSIMEGCSKYCSFCVVPYTRGEEVSRPLADVLRECEGLVAQGVREITLLGQNVNAWRGALAAGGHADLALLIELLARLPRLERIRFTTSHPVEFGDALVDAYAGIPKLAGVLHLPVQSGSDRILSLMKRGHTRAQYLDKVRRARAARPGLSLSTDVIVGFPSETEADFEATLGLVDEAGIDCAYTFAYSPRPGTPAASLRDAVPPEVKESRLQRLQALIRERDDAFKRALVGTVQRVLVEKPGKRPGQLSGRTDGNRWLNFDGPATLHGSMVEVIVTEALTNSLRGRRVERAVAA
ncbi:MAG TPA: tRNA (N6-isopentenyl adenosine(37)-C2)-methylthiotransferase MiaB [Candidatus Binatia bacterium]|nr:tRNA (N6-isopentenyl adenosine(37)-C2)-methylthiotransferase MiaB [Candidatus Binatia bacterium]